MSSISSPPKGRIIVFGILFWFPLAGVTYQFLHFLIGLRRLGYDVFYIEDSGRWVYNPRLGDVTPDVTENLNAIVPILEAHGFKDRWAFRGRYAGGKCHGMSEEAIFRLYRDADAFLNVTGSQDLCEEHLACRCRVYLETDPVVLQIKVANGEMDSINMLKNHHKHFSYGGNFGQPDCQVPLGEFNWLPTVQPVLMDMWDNVAIKQPEAAFNTIATWQNRGRDIVFQGETYYWSKDREFRKFLDLPKRRSGPFELAVGVDDETRQLLELNRWRVSDPVRVSSDMTSYHRFILESRGEFTVAKDQNIRLRSGWFSDRSACYLAASRPVINQDTGFGSYLPTGKGLFAFRTMDDILAAVDEIESDYEGNCRAAREIAADYFAAEKVLGSVMQRSGL